MKRYNEKICSNNQKEEGKGEEKKKKCIIHKKYKYTKR